MPSAARRELERYARRIALVGMFVLVLLVLGALGLESSEGVGFWYGFRWALDTAATVGGFPQPHTTGGQVIQVALVLVGVGVLFYALAVVADLFVAGHLSDLLRSRRMQHTIDSLSGHHIVCGFGRVGRQVARDLVAAEARCVVVDTDANHREGAEALGLSFIEGDATDDAVLRSAGVARAQSIMACADSDANNVFITLTARELRADITIVARAAVEDTEKKLKRAGADRVISPYKSSGTEMARLALHRQLSGVLDVDAQYRIEEIEVADRSAGVGSTIGAVRGGLTIVGLRRGSVFQPQPPGDTALQALDVVVAMGAPVALERLERMLEAPA
ncbi:MAG TPA: TrkA family potassium uptake protein [Solirubrobacteraceae bacterium]|nr:TrkA family potassium uptake protein [Solirubrobacteraceae bacterium]